MPPPVASQRSRRRRFGGGGAAHLTHALLQRVHAVHAGMHVGEAAAIGVSRQLPPGGGVALGDKGCGLATGISGVSCFPVTEEVAGSSPVARANFKSKT
jgi:hypothetical protein